MSRIVINGDVTLKRNNATDAQGVAIPPTLEALGYGEIAINYNAKDACIFIKALDSNGQQKIVKFVGEEVIAKTLGDILGESAADLATLKEMIKLFEGSSSDVLTLVKNLQTEVALKANKTYVDSELAKKLGKTETAYNSNRLGNYEDKYYLRYRGVINNETNLDNLTTNGSFKIYGRTGDISNYGTFLSLDGDSFKAQFSLPRADNQSILFRGRTDVNNVWSSWRFLYDSLNCNNDSTNWNCLTLIAKLSGEFGKSGNYYSRITNNAHWIINADGTVRCGYTFDTSTNEPKWNKNSITKTIWNGHNSNIDSADWKCNNLSANQWHLRRSSDNSVGFAARIDGGNNALLTNNSGSGGFYVGLNVGGNGQRFALSILGKDGFMGVNNEDPKYQLDCTGEINASSNIITGNSCFFKVSGYNSGYINGWRYDNSNGGLRFNVIKGGVGKEALFITKDSNVGIDKADIGAKLDVGGDIRARQLIHITKNNGATCIKIGSGSSSADAVDGFGWIGLFDKNGDTIPKTQIYASGVSWFNGGYVGFGTSLPTERVHVVGNGLFTGNLRVLGETYTYSADGIETFEAGGGATRLADLTDVDLSGVQGNFVLYQSNETNANGDRVWKARSDAKSWSDISGKPTTFTPVEHNHIGSTSVTTPSDRSLKTDLKRIDLATNTILSLTPYTYNWTTQAIETFGFKSHHAAGVIAQEIENILPFAVQPLNDEFKAVDYIQIIPYLIAAFQELHSALQDKNIAIANATKEYKRMYGANEKLAKRVSDLESELINLKNQIAA